jgi:phage FluMu protein Com
MGKSLTWRCLGCGKTHEGGATIPVKCPHCGDDESDQAEFEMVEVSETPTATGEKKAKARKSKPE